MGKLSVNPSEPELPVGIAGDRVGKNAFRLGFSVVDLSPRTSKEFGAPIGADVLMWESGNAHEPKLPWSN